ncbi:MAG: hypothetical protein JWN48_1447 [Myxococcaceae bacterium]|nr:hypothetical protein [Myxococcaceae bacterium]
MRSNPVPARSSVAGVSVAGLDRGATIVPAPWRLRGEGYVLMIKLPMPRGRAELFAPTELAEARFGQFGCVMFMEYLDSPVGPYRELLFIPGTFRFGKRRLPSITKIYVSTQASVDSGQHNWGIPKELADFECVDGADGVKRVTLRVDGRIAVELWLRHNKLPLPITSRVLPTNVRTLGQVYSGRTYAVTPSARGLMQRAKVVHAWSEPGAFADLSSDRVVMAVRVSKVELGFPLASVT